MKFCEAFWVTFSNLTYAIIRYSHWGKPFDGYTHTEHIPTRILFQPIFSKQVYPQLHKKTWARLF